MTVGTLSVLMTSVADPAVLGEVAHGVGYGCVLFMSFLWSEVRRSRAAKEHATVQSAKTAEQEAKREERRERDRRLYQEGLDYRFGELHRELNEHRESLNTELQELSLEVKGISRDVGVGTENGLKGQVRELRGRFDDFLRDQLNARRT